MWYGALGLIAFALAVVTVTVFDTKLPVWALIIALIFAMVFVIPIGMIRAITNQMVALQILAELVVGYMLPGRPVAMMIFKTFSFIAMSQALSFLSDLKLGHYMKIPPRMMFLAQVIATIVSVFVVVGVQSWMFSNIPDLCQPDQPHSFTCPSTSVFATAAMVWGGVGPRRLFSSGALYNPLMYFFLIGAFLPLPFYYLARRYPLSFWRYVNVPVMMAGVAVLPPATGINFSSWFTFGAFFQYFMRRFHYRVSSILTRYFLDLWFLTYIFLFSGGCASTTFFLLRWILVLPSHSLSSSSPSNSRKGALNSTGGETPCGRTPRTGTALLSSH